LLVLRTRGRYVGRRRRSRGGDDGDLITEQISEVSRTDAHSAACAVTRQMPLDCCLLQVLREAWATDLDLPAFTVRVEQASEVSSTAVCSAACAVTR